MKESDSSDQRFRALATGYLLGTNTDEENEELEVYLNQGAENREKFRRWVHLDAVLHKAAQDQSVETSADNSQESMAWYPPGWAPAVQAVAAILIIGLLLGGVWLNRFTAGPKVADDGVAVLSRSVGAKWKDDRDYFDGASLAPGKIAIESGIIQIDFHSGASLIARGPSQLELKDPMNAICHSGELSVFVPPAAKGFRIQTPDGEVIDYGTEFGLTVRDSKTGVEVIDGEVEWVDARDPSLRQRLSEGHSIGDVVSYPLREDLEIAETDAADLIRQRWESAMGALASDPDLRILYRFDDMDRLGRVVTNAAPDAPEATFGSTIGGAWTEGHVRGTNAVELKRVGERIRFLEPRPYEAATLMMLVRIDSLENQYNSLMHSDGSPDGGIHWRVRDNGKLGLGIRINGKWVDLASSAQTVSQDDLGRWILVAATLDPSTRSAALYRNGERVALAERLTPGKQIHLRAAELGNWNIVKGNRVRSLDGRIGFFATWNRALSPQEILEVYEAFREPSSGPRP